MIFTTTLGGGPERLRFLVVGFVLGVLVGAGLLVAHVSGFFDHFYHIVGLHSLVQEAGHQAHQDPGMPGHAGHTGHEGHTPEKSEPSKVPGYAIVKISPARQQLIGLRTGKVRRDRLLMSIRTVGIIEPDQTRLRRLHTRISGWATKVHVSFVGQKVNKGSPLLEIYSPDLLSTQEEYLQALASWESRPGDDAAKRLVEATRRRLELWGVPADEIQNLQKTRKAQETLTLRAPISGQVLERKVLEGSYIEPAMELYQIADLSVVWLQARIYEHELPHIELNQPVKVMLPSQPGKVFEGKVSFVEPVLQETTRTVKVRVEIQNPADLFKPGMYADLEIQHDMGQGLLVPESAVLRTGERAIAFRTLPEGRFDPVQVKLGARFGDNFEVLAGLTAGDEVVTSGNFLIDSDSRLKAATGAMGHAGHGGH